LGAIVGDLEAFGVGAFRGRNYQSAVPRLPGTFIQNAFLKLRVEYYWESVVEIVAPNAVRRFMLHFSNFLPARFIGLGAPPAPGYNAAMTRTKKMPFGKHKGENIVSGRGASAMADDNKTHSMFFRLLICKDENLKFGLRTRLQAKGVRLYDPNGSQVGFGFLLTDAAGVRD
jgi:hypothetical protein